MFSYIILKDGITHGATGRAFLVSMVFRTISLRFGKTSASGLAIASTVTLHTTVEFAFQVKDKQ